VTQHVQKSILLNLRKIKNNVSKILLPLSRLLPVGEIIVNNNYKAKITKRRIVLLTPYKEIFEVDAPYRKLKTKKIVHECGYKDFNNMYWDLTKHRRRAIRKNELYWLYNLVFLGEINEHHRGIKKV